MKISLRNALALVLTVGAFSGCSQDLKKGLCPSANVLANTAEASVFRDGMEGNQEGVLYKVQVSGVTTDCDFDQDEGTADSSLVVSFRVTRTPSAVGGSYTVPFYVAAVRDSSAVVSKQVYTASFSFRPGEATTSFTNTVPSYVVRFDNGKKPYDYGLLTGLQLTRAQLDFNKKMGRFAP